jgi:DNA polymerase-3 subunit beta
MKIRCVREDILQAVLAAQRIVSSRAVMPVLTGVALRGKGDTVQVNATDLELALNTGFSCSAEEEGETVVNAKLLGDILRNLSQETVWLEKSGSDLMIKDDRSTFLLRTMAIEDFPALPQVEDALVTKAPSGTVLRALGQVRNAVSKDERRMILTGVLFDIKGTVLTVVGTDSYRLAMRSIELGEAAVQEREMIVPGRAVVELARWGDHEQPLDIFVSEGQVRFVQGERSLTARLIEGRFPNYTDFVPKNTQVELRFDKAEMENAVKRMSLVASTILMKVETGSIVLESNASEVGEAREAVAIEGSGEMEIAFNAEYLKDGIDVVEGEKTELLLVDGEKPALIKDVGDSGYRYVIMPVRVKR